MFETLDQLVPEQVVTRRWQLLIYGTFGLAGLVFVALSILEHGFWQPVSLVNACAMFFLSLTCFSTTLRSAAPLTKRKHLVQNALLLLLMTVNVIVRL
jgi:hypothetical protein